MFRLLGLRLEGIKSLCVSDQLFTFLDSDKPQLTVNMGGKAEGTRPSSTHIRGFSVDSPEAVKTKYTEHLLVCKVGLELKADMSTTSDTS